MKKCSMQKKIESLSPMSKANTGYYDGPVTYSIIYIKQDDHKIANPVKGHTFKTTRDLYENLNDIFGNADFKVIAAGNYSPIEGWLDLQSTTEDGTTLVATVWIELESTNPVRAALNNLDLPYSEPID